MIIALIGDGVGIGANANKGIVIAPLSIKANICLLRVSGAIGRYSKGSDIAIPAIGNGECSRINLEQGIVIASIVIRVAPGCIVLYGTVILPSFNTAVLLLWVVLAALPPAS